LRAARLFFGNEGEKFHIQRRKCLADRIRLLSSLLAIDICSYAVMSNQYQMKKSYTIDSG